MQVRKFQTVYKLALQFMLSPGINIQWNILVFPTPLPSLLHPYFPFHHPTYQHLPILPSVVPFSWFSFSFFLPIDIPQQSPGRCPPFSTYLRIYLIYFMFPIFLLKFLFLSVDYKTNKFSKENLKYLFFQGTAYFHIVCHIKKLSAWIERKIKKHTFCPPF